MKIIKVPIFTEEYKIIVVVGSKKELIDYLVKEYDVDRKKAENWCELARGTAWDFLPDRHPVIVLDADLPWQQAICTLPHEACHAVGYIMEHLGIREELGGEFMAHSISAVMRHYLEKIKHPK